MSKLTAPPSIPSKHRLALVMLLVIYPFVTTILYLIMPLTEGWPLWARTALLAPIMVVSIVYGIAPAIQKHLAWFIVRKPRGIA